MICQRKQFPSFWALPILAISIVISDTCHLKLAPENSLHAFSIKGGSAQKEHLRGGHFPVKSPKKIPDPLMQVLREFESALEKDRLDACRSLYAQMLPLQNSIPEETFFLATLHLARLEMLKGFSSQAISLLEDLSPPEKSQLQLAFFLLKARLHASSHPEIALSNYQKAQEITESSQWDSEDQSAFSFFQKSLEKKWARRIEQATRLKTAGLYDEALVAIDSLLEDLEIGSHPKAQKGSERYQLLYWKWNATKIKWLIDQGQADQALLCINSIDPADLTEKGRLHRSFLLALVHATQGNIVLAERALDSEPEPLYLQENLRLLKGRIYLAMGQGVQARSILKPIISSSHLKHRIWASLYMAQLQIMRGKNKEAITILEELQSLKDPAFIDAFAERNLLLAKLYEEQKMSAPSTAINQKYQALLVEILESKRVAHPSYRPAFSLLLQKTSELSGSNYPSGETVDEGAKAPYSQHYLFDVLLSSALTIVDAKKDLSSEEALTLLQLVMGEPSLKKVLQSKVLSFLHTRAFWKADDENKWSSSLAGEVALLYLHTLDPGSSGDFAAADLSESMLSFKHPATLLRAQLLHTKTLAGAPLFSTIEKIEHSLQKLAATVEAKKLPKAQLLFSLDALLDCKALLLEWQRLYGSSDNERLQASLTTSMDLVDRVLEPFFARADRLPAEHLLVKYHYNTAVKLYLANRDFSLWSSSCDYLVKGPSASEFLFALAQLTDPGAPWKQPAAALAFENHAQERDAQLLQVCQTLLDQFSHNSHSQVDPREKETMLIQARLYHRTGQHDRATSMFEQLSDSFGEKETVQGQSKLAIALQAYSPQQYLTGDLRALAHLTQSILDKRPYSKEHMIAYYYLLESMHSGESDLPHQQHLLEEVDQALESLLSNGDVQIQTDPQLWWLVHFFELEKASILIEQKQYPQANAALRECEQELTTAVQKTQSEYFTTLADRCAYLWTRLMQKAPISFSNSKRGLGKLSQTSALEIDSSEQSMWKKAMILEKVHEWIDTHQEKKALHFLLQHHSEKEDSEFATEKKLLIASCHLALGDLPLAKSLLQQVASEPILSFPQEQLFYALCQKANL